MKKLIYLLSLVMIITMASCTADTESARIDDTTTSNPKTLYVECNKVADTIKLEILNSSNQVIETQIGLNTFNKLFTIDKGVKFNLRCRVINQHFGGKYIMYKDYGNTIVLQDSYTSWYNLFEASREY